MAAVAMALARRRTKQQINVVGISAETVQELSLAGGLMMGNSSLHQVAGAVHFVPITQILPAHLRLGDRKVRVEITIRLLCTNNLVNHVIDQKFKFRIGMRAERIAGSFQPLGRIRITEN